MVFFKKYFYFIIVFLIPFNFVKASTVQTNDDLFPVIILCGGKNLQAKIEESINERRFVLNTVLIEFNPLLGGSLGLTERTVLLSYDGFLPKNYWNNITFDEPYVSFGHSRITGSPNEKLPCKDNYDVDGPCNISNPEYVAKLPEYITTSTDVYINIGYSETTVNRYSIKINRESLWGEYKYNDFYPERRREGSGFLDCKLLKAGDKKPNYLNIWNKYQQKVREAFNREKQKKSENKF